MENVILNNTFAALYNFMRNVGDPSVPEDQKYTYVRPDDSTELDNVEDKDKVADDSKESKVSTEESKVNINIAPKVKANEKLKAKVETKKSSNDKKEEQKITMQDRRECPVKVLSKEEKVAIKKKDDHHKHGEQHELEHHLQHFVQHLRDANIEFTAPVRVPTGLYELCVINKNNQQVLISADIDGILYDNAIKFFIGRVLPGEEYSKKCFLLTKSSAEALKSGSLLPEKCSIPENLFILNRVVDLQTLKEKDEKKREATFKTVANIISDSDFYNGILKAANGEPYRFAFSRYTSPTDFSIVSSSRNLSSNLTNDHLNVSKEIWINVKDENVSLTTKKATR